MLLCQEELEMLRKGHRATAGDKDEAPQNADLWHQPSLGHRRQRAESRRASRSVSSLTSAAYAGGDVFSKPPSPKHQTWLA